VVALTFDRSSIDIGETATATVTASWFGAQGTYMGGLAVDLIASGGFVGVSDIAPIAWNNPALGLTGQAWAGGQDVRGVAAGQLSLLPPYTTANPLLITTSTVTGHEVGALSYHSETMAGFKYSFHLVDTSFISPIIFWGNDVFESETLVVTPGPGVVGALGVVGVVGAGRRRR
jgi:hypothetical protein